MRQRLAAAVASVLEDPALAGAPDAVRLAAVVLLAKTSAAELTATVTAGELGRWLGVTRSQVSHTVRPRLQQGAVRSEEIRQPGSRRTASIRWSVARFVWARHHGPADHPLRLSRPELATLLRLCEALFGPGWSQTPPGLLAARTGHGAATDRLGLLLAVLHARANGTVRLCGGAVDARGRLAATMARLLGSSTAAGARVLERLLACGALEQLTGARERLIVPAVAAAHRRMRAEARSAGRSLARRRTPAGGKSAPAGEATAQGGQNPPSGEKQQVTTGGGGVRPGEDSAHLHADHSRRAGVVETGSEGEGFSGEAPLGTCAWPVRAREREDQDHAQDVAGPRAVRSAAVGDQGALRAGKHLPTPLSLSLQRRVPRTAQLLGRVVGEATVPQRRLLDRLVSGLLLEGEDDAMIAARLRERLAPLATNDPARPWAFQRDGLAWALAIGLPYARGGMTLVPCRNRHCRQVVRGRATDRVRCDGCEVAALDAVHAARQQVPSLQELERTIGLSSGPERQVLPPEPRAERARAAAQPDRTEAAEADGGAAPLPQVVREQLAVLATADPAAARTAEQAATAMYREPGEGETEEQRRYRTSKASAEFCAVISQFATVLSAHYSQACR